MSTENYAHLSDIEIQRKLTQNGFPLIPVTETTRPILIKKLMKHMKNEKLKKGKVTNYVLYSKDNHNSANSAPVAIQEKSNLFDNVHENNNDIQVFKNHPVIYKSDANVNTMQSAAARMYAPPPVLASNYDSENEQHALNISNKYRKTRSIAGDSPSYTKINGKANMCDGGVVNRLLSFRDTSTKKKKFNSKDVYSVPMSNAFTSNGIFHKLISFDLKSYLRKPDVSLHIIPHVLIASLVIFLAMISVLYAAKKFELSPISHTDLTYTICDPNDKDLQLASQKTTCISEDLFKKAMYISEELFKYLNERARIHHCIDKDHSPTLELDDLKKALSENTNILKGGNPQKKLLATQYLIAQNPQWMIKTTVSTHNSSEEILSFELTQPNLPIKCIILKKMSRFFTAIGLLLLIALAGLIIYFLIAFYRIKQKERLLAAEHFIKDIINELMYQSSVSENSELIINELQDKFLPAQKRSKLLYSWNKALKTLEANDNRVLFGMIVRNGEQLRTMTWNKSIGNKETSTSKKWQSSAFDNSNKILNPPTSCLKIRHMFDQSEIDQPNLRQSIVESIFEKVGSNCKICDVQLDKQSCCVYIRCATEADAGMVHNEINGWWFDKNLISIKFLRLERYLSRFPKSLADPMYFKSPNV
ncbi:inner nuclear membrane protein Man1 [Drosophila innubila]|uniref:inner nuclear membrane protein Man1 n=1 Tax=Drosophila innubila TaxID=198719 RepID=UPI00148CC64A|nr:inner nuclear membrane protein Man1 [Drosophila innubila]